MLLTPLDRPFEWKNPPRLVLGLCLLLLVIFVPWHMADLRLEKELSRQYQDTLMATEWPLYETHALKTGQRTTLKRLQAEYSAGKEDPARLDSVALYIAMDDGFVQSMQQQGQDYLAPEKFSAWQEARAAFDPQRSKLGRRALGVDPQAFRPITFVTFGLVQGDVVQLLAALVLLLTIGIAMELALGSGALLAALLGGGATGAVAFLLSNGSNVLPLTGATVGVSAIAGMFFTHFRAGKVLLFKRQEIPAYSLGLLWLLLVAVEFIVSPLRSSELIARIAALASGPLWAFAYARWFVNAADFMPVISSGEPEDEKGQAYRQQLHLALEAVARLEFTQAQKLLRDLYKQNPSDMRVLTQLYYVEKLNPGNAGYDAVARRLFNFSAAENDQLVLNTYRDYIRYSSTRAALDTDTSLKLISRLTRMKEVMEADKLMRQVLDRKTPHPQIAKTALALADALERLREPARARFLRQSVE